RRLSLCPYTTLFRSVVAPGDTLWAIARRYEVSVEAIQLANGIVDPGRLRVGQNLVIPAIGGGDDVVAVPAVSRVADQVVSLATPDRKSTRLNSSHVK